MAGEFVIEVTRWLERVQGSPPERESFGEVEIRWDDLVLTQLEDQRAATVRPAARVSVLHLGTWLAANWWRLRWEPLPANPDADWRVAHQVGAAGGGFVWPLLQFAADGQTITFSLRDTLRGGPPIRYLRRAEGTIDARVFERAVDGLMTVLLARLSSRHVDATDLVQAWSEVCAERRDPTESTRRRREALLGLDPDAITGGELAALAGRGAWMGDAALDEAMAAMRAAEIGTAIGRLEQLRRQAGPQLDLAPLDAAARAWRSASNAFAEPWERGASIAGVVRREVGLSPDEPVASSRLAAMLSHDVTADPVDGSPFAACFRSADSPERLKFYGVRRHPTSRRFEAARILAEFVDAPAGDAVLPMTDTSTARQKVQRAFAQEFLCPAQALAQMLPLPAPSDADIEAAAGYFDVSDFVVRSALVNRGLIERHYLPGCRPS